MSSFWPKRPRPKRTRLRGLIMRLQRWKYDYFKYHVVLYVVLSRVLGAAVAQVVERVGRWSEGRIGGSAVPLRSVTCVMVIVSLGKALHPPCLVWMCLRWWSEGPQTRNGSHASASSPQGSWGYQLAHHHMDEWVWMNNASVKCLWVPRKAWYK